MKNEFLMSKEDFLTGNLEVSGFSDTAFEVSLDDEKFCSVEIGDVQRLISKLYLQYNDVEAKEFLDNLEY